MSTGLNFGELYRDADGNIYKLICCANGNDGEKVIFAKVDLSVGDPQYCSVEQFNEKYMMTSYYI